MKLGAFLILFLLIEQLAVDGIIIRRIYQPEPHEETPAEGVVPAGHGEGPAKIETPPQPEAPAATEKESALSKGDK